MTTKEINTLIGPVKKLYEVTPSIVSDDKGNYVCDSLIIEPQTKYFPSKEVDGFVYSKIIEPDYTNPTVETIRSVFGENARIFAYSTSYSETKSQKDQNRTMLVEKGNCCVSDITCSYIVGVNKAQVKIPDRIGNTRIYVNEPAKDVLIINKKG